MSYDFHLICEEDPRKERFAYAAGEFENKFTYEKAKDSQDLILSLAGEALGLITEPIPVPQSELRRLFGDDVATQLGGQGWVSDVNIPLDKEDAESVRAFLMIAVIGTKGVLIDPQSQQVINADWGS
ncbi:hypothetical protein ACIPY3_11055 [Paenarthrobacter sp. NPDC089714]|uniref:hypothetical protein n=1 Tax=unclassified Paenarthrobacter TaxID=2634190 RepID=UPI00380A4A8C